MKQRSQMNEINQMENFLYTTQSRMKSSHYFMMHNGHLRTQSSPPHMIFLTRFTSIVPFLWPCTRTLFIQCASLDTVRCFLANKNTDAKEPSINHRILFQWTAFATTSLLSDPRTGSITLLTKSSNFFRQINAYTKRTPSFEEKFIQIEMKRTWEIQHWLQVHHWLSDCSMPMVLDWGQTVHSYQNIPESDSLLRNNIRFDNQEIKLI